MAVRRNSPGFWQTCGICHEPFIGDLHMLMAQEQLRHLGGSLEAKLNGLLEVGHAHLPIPADVPRAVEIFEECVSICHQLYGADVWNDDVFLTYTNLANALQNSGRVEEALQTFELVKMKLVETGIQSWKHYSVQSIYINLSQTYMNQEKFTEAMPILKDMVTNEQHLDDLHKIHTKKMLAMLLVATSIGEQKKAREFAEEAHGMSKQMNGSTHPLTLECKSNWEQVVSKSFTYGKSNGIEGIPEGEIVEIKEYHDGVFSASILSPVPNKDDRDLTNLKDIACSFSPPGYFHTFGNSLFWVDTNRGHFVLPDVSARVDQVIIENDSDVVIHSLEGAKSLNGKLGVIRDFSAKMGRYAIKVKGRDEIAWVKPKNLLPVFMGCPRKDTVKRAKKLFTDG
jgi:hypothetical protein